MEISRHRGLPGGRAVLGGVLMALAVVACSSPTSRPVGRPTTRSSWPRGPSASARCWRPTDLRTVDGELPGRHGGLRRRRRAGRTGAAGAGRRRRDRAGRIGHRRSGDGRRARGGGRAPRRQIAVGRLKEGERVDIFVTYDSERSRSCRARRSCRSAPRTTARSRATARSRSWWPCRAGRRSPPLVHALRTGDVTVVRSTFAEASIDDPLEFEAHRRHPPRADEAG